MREAPPNILFMFTDQHRWDWVGYEGRVPVRTRNLDRLAARGVTFSSCRVASPMCAPSRACLAAGVRYGRCGVARQPGRRRSGATDLHAVPARGRLPGGDVRQE